MSQDTTTESRQSPTIEVVLKKFEQWRTSRVKRSRIPNHLWDAAVELYDKYTICQISKALRLNYNDLKRRILDTAEPTTVSSPAFIQLDFTRQPEQEQWIIEIQNTAGDRMKISGSACRLPDIAQLSHVFLRDRR